MQREKEFRERCAARSLDVAAIERAVATVEALAKDTSLESANLAEVERHVAALVAKGPVEEERIMALARYFTVCGEDEVAIRLLAYLLPIGVLQAMGERLASLEGEATRDAVMASVAIPPSGSPPEAYPAATAAFVEALERELGTERSRRVLAWNVHGIPATAFAQERELYLAAPSIRDWLKGFHDRQVAVLEKHAADGSLWFEQKITSRVVDFVRENPEILGGVVEGDSIFATKIPYDPDRFLASSDPLEKRRLACHCPLAASTINAEGAGVGALWCNCSAGFEKVLFDTVFGVETEVDVLESVLAGDSRCRFAIGIPGTGR